MALFVAWTVSPSDWGSQNKAVFLSSDKVMLPEIHRAGLRLAPQTRSLRVGSLPPSEWSPLVGLCLLPQVGMSRKSLKFPAQDFVVLLRLVLPRAELCLFHLTGELSFLSDGSSLESLL